MIRFPLTAVALLLTAVVLADPPQAAPPPQAVLPVAQLPQFVFPTEFVAAVPSVPTCQCGCHLGKECTCVDCPLHGSLKVHRGSSGYDLAKKSGRPVVVVVRSADCRFCDWLDVALKSQEVAPFLRDNFNVVELAAEESAWFTVPMEVSRYPSTWVFGTDEKERDRFDGYLPPTELVGRFRSALAASKGPPRGSGGPAAVSGPVVVPTGLSGGPTGLPAGLFPAFAPAFAPATAPRGRVRGGGSC